MATITSGSAAATCSQVRRCEWLAGPGEGVNPTGPLDHLWHPVPAGERGIEPLQGEDAGRG